MTLTLTSGLSVTAFLFCFLNATELNKPTFSSCYFWVMLYKFSVVNRFQGVMANQEQLPIAPLLTAIIDCQNQKEAKRKPVPVANRLSCQSRCLIGQRGISSNHLLFILA